MFRKPVSVLHTIVLLVFVGFTQLAYAGPADCDGVLNDAQKEQRKFCDTHMGCSLVTSIMDSCISVKSFLKALSSTGPSKVSDGMVSEALEEIGVPKPGIGSCTTSFDRSQCRQFLGIEQAPIPVAPVKFTPTPQQDVASMARELRTQYGRAKLPGDEYRVATNAIAFCAQSVLHDSRYEQVCSDAQRRVDECMAYREGWYARRKIFLESAPKVDLATAAETIARLEMPYCPTTLSEVDPVTPIQAIARRKVELEAPPRVGRTQQMTAQQEIDPTGDWVISDSTVLYRLNLAATKLTISILSNGESYEFERKAPGTYHATNNSGCVINVRSAKSIEQDCGKDVTNIIPLSEVLTMKQGRIDLTGTWAENGNMQIRTHISMTEIGLRLDTNTDNIIDYVQTAPNSYALGSPAKKGCKFTVISSDLIAAACKTGNYKYSRLTPQQVVEANRVTQTQAAPAPVVSMSGYWRCDKGNRVQMNDRRSGYAVVGTGASGEFFFRKVNQTTFHYDWPNGTHSDAVLIDNNTLRTSNPDGWSDVCHRE